MFYQFLFLPISGDWCKYTTFFATANILFKIIAFFIYRFETKINPIFAPCTS